MFQTENVVMFPLKCVAFCRTRNLSNARISTSWSLFDLCTKTPPLPLALLISGQNNAPNFKKWSTYRDNLHFLSQTNLVLHVSEGLTFKFVRRWSKVCMLVRMKMEFVETRHYSVQVHVTLRWQPRNKIYCEIISGNPVQNGENWWY